MANLLTVLKVRVTHVAPIFILARPTNLPTYRAGVVVVEERVEI